MTDRSVAHGGRSLLVALTAIVVAAGCGDDGGAIDGDRSDAPTSSGLEVEILVEGLQGPTQLAAVGDGTFVVAELAGGEDDGVGRVVRWNPDVDEAPTELQAELLTPTGVAVVDGELWVMEQRRLSRAPLEPGAPRSTVLDALPFNGRSQGTLTPAPGGGLLYDTSGRIRDGEVVDGSGALWQLDSDGESSIVAAGFKHAYAHVFDADGRLWSTEISDGRYDGEPAGDELVEVITGGDGGWPACVDAGRVVEEYGGTPERCAAAFDSHARFEVGATPTSVAVAPWDPDVLLVALWVPGEIVAVPRTAPDGVPHTAESLGLDVGRPQHLLADGDRLLVVDFDGGRILSITRR